MGLKIPANKDGMDLTIPTTKDGVGMTLRAIVHGKLADPAADALRDGVILIEGDRIVAAGQVDVPGDA